MALRRRSPIEAVHSRVEAPEKIISWRLHIKLKLTLKSLTFKLSQSQTEIMRQVSEIERALILIFFPFRKAYYKNL